MKKIIIAIFALWLLVPSYNAQALTISPARIELSADPGVIVRDEFLAINEQGDQTFYLSAENFTSQGEGGTPAFTPGKDGLASWIKVEPQVTITKGGEAKIPFNIEIPANADNGGYFAAIFLNTSPPDPSGNNNVSVGAKLGVLVFLRVGKDIKDDGGIIEFKTIGEQNIYNALPVNFFYRFKNSGGDRAKPQGQLKVLNVFGATSASINANPQEGNVLPGSIRRFELNWGGDQKVPTGFFDIIKYQANHFALGRYKADLILTYGAANNIVSSQYVFWVLPWQLILSVILLIIIIFFIIRVILKRYNRWVISQARASMRQ